MVHYGLPRTTKVIHAFYLTGRDPPKRKVNVDREKALETLVDGYLTRRKTDFLQRVPSFLMNLLYLINII